MVHKAAAHGREEPHHESPELSVVLPCFNEAANLPALLARLRTALRAVSGENWEVVFVDDGSTDESAEILDQMANGDNRIAIVHFSRNFGHQAALAAGLVYARGRAVIMMDSDLQDPPEVIYEFVTRWREGYDVVYALRRKRKEGILKRMAYGTFYRSLRVLAELDVPADAGDFCLLDRRVVSVLAAMRERHRFLRGLRSWVGFRQIGVEYERAARVAGEPKYTFRKLFGLAVSGYVGFSAAPLRIATWLGMAAASVGFVILLWAAMAKVAGVDVPPGWTSMITAVMFLGGTQLVVTGILGEYLSRIYDEVRGRPLFVVRDAVGRKPGEDSLGS